jgi:hypothetical protein
MLANFGFEGLDFQLECTVLLRLSHEKTPCQLCFLIHALWREHIDVPKLICALTEVLYIDSAFVDERLQAVVQASGADAQLLSQLALSHVRVVLQDAHAR